MLVAGFKFTNEFKPQRGEIWSARVNILPRWGLQVKMPQISTNILASPRLSILNSHMFSM